ncbi:hypothetical protein [Ornithinibacillus halophilus]|uniref:Uncharacterized protein n=1 Tax=Ornithinibacillus halophilus TaxID=930117 RepID=A0A1M5L8T6_9BACI|nr:hypothetical protein [Ornithinibacillus halophilus]SHG61159.1 hypothetical protein SAMN05216225_10456 [Ornithinibacillus halophilus]
MNWSILLTIISLIFLILSFLNLRSFRNEFKKLNTGDVLSDELVKESRKKIWTGLTLFGISSILSLIVIFVSSN